MREITTLLEIQSCGDPKRNAGCRGLSAARTGNDWLLVIDDNAGGSSFYQLGRESKTDAILACPEDDGYA